MAEYENASKRRRLDEAEGDDRINQNKLNVVNNAEQSVEILSIRANVSRYSVLNCESDSKQKH